MPSEAKAAKKSSIKEPMSEEAKAAKRLSENERCRVLMAKRFKKLKEDGQCTKGCGRPQQSATMCQVCLDKMKVRCVCKCGGRYTWVNRNTHMGSQRHRKYENDLCDTNEVHLCDAAA